MSRLLWVAEAGLGHAWPSHPECDQRVVACEATMVELQDELEVEGKKGAMERLSAGMWPPVPHAALSMVHGQAHLARLESVAATAATGGPVALCDPDDPDGPTYMTASSWAAATAAVAAGLALVDAVAAAPASGKPPPAGLALTRPPGHHASEDEAMGFCLLNTIAVAARHAQRAHGLSRVLILDWDVHHGNGTQDIFYEDASVLFMDLHAAGVWPGTGALEELGRGFDAHRADPLGGLSWESVTYGALAASVRDLAAEVCGGRCIFFLEGGYHLSSLAESVGCMAGALLGHPISCGERVEGDEDEEVGVVLAAVRKLHGLEAPQSG